MADLNQQDIKHIAELAKIKFTDKEIEKFQKELSVILDYVENLSQVNTSKVEPTAQVTGLESIIRRDEVDSCSEKVMDKLVAAFPEAENRMLKVKKIFDNQN